MADEGAPNLSDAGDAFDCPICHKQYTIRSSFLRHSRQCLERVVSTPRQKSCRQCSTAKTRCDQKHPCCSRCALRNHACEYVTRGSKIQQEESSLPKTRNKSKKASSGQEDAARQEADQPRWNVPNPSTGYTNLTNHQLWDNSTSRAPSDYCFDAPTTNGEPDAQYDPALAQINVQSNVPDPEPPSATTVPHSLHLPPTSPTEGGDITQIQHRWLYPYVEESPAKVALMKQSMSLISRVFRTYPRMMARKKQLPPFMHQNQLSSSCLPLPLINCFILSQWWQTSATEDGGSDLVQVAIRREMDRLFNEYRTYNAETLLTTFQVLLIYSIILLFPVPQKPSTGTFDPLILVSLQELCFHLCQKNLVLPAETSRTRPPYKDWIAVNCKRRTIMAVYCFEWMYAVLNDLPTFPCAELGFMLAPTGKELWNARTEEEWEVAYESWLVRWKDGEYTLKELDRLKPGPELDRRSEMWLEEADEFGMIYMALSNATEGPTDA